MSDRVLPRDQFENLAVIGCDWLFSVIRIKENSLKFNQRVLSCWRAHMSERGVRIFSIHGPTLRMYFGKDIIDKKVIKEKCTQKYLGIYSSHQEMCPWLFLTAKWREPCDERKETGSRKNITPPGSRRL